MLIRRWVILTAAALASCASDPAVQRRDLSPADFAAPAPRPAPPATQAASAPPATAPAPSPSRAVDAAKPGDQALAVDAMVGQVNGRAVYASTVFDDLDQSLTQIGRSSSRDDFIKRGQALISDKLDLVIINALTLGDAERDLVPQEQTYLPIVLKEHEGELIREYGGGSRSVAEEEVRKRFGIGFDDMMNNFRKRMLVERYIQKKLVPQINVTRKDIDRYYQAHPEIYNPAPTRKLRLIRTDDPADADTIDKLLADGKPFDQVAALPLNQFNAAQAGVMENAATGDKFFGSDALNQAMARLDAGQHSPRVPVGKSFNWIKVDSVQGATPRSLEEVQLDIKSLLERQQFQRLTSDYQRKLLKDGSYAPRDVMLKMLMEVALNRYAAPR